MRLDMLAAPAFPSPASRTSVRFRIHGFDFFWALLAPILALYLADAYILYAENGIGSVALYCLTSFAATATTLFIFRVHDGVVRYFSVHDALAIIKAVVVSALITFVVLFAATRLEGIPRSTLIDLALLLASGFISVRIFTRVTADNRWEAHQENIATEHIIILGANSRASLYIKLLQMCSSSNRPVVAVLDARKEMFGRAIEGVRIVGAPEQLDAIVQEYSVHGIEIGRVIVAGETDLISSTQMSEIARVCESRLIAFDFLPQLLGLEGVKTRSEGSQFQIERCRGITLSRYFIWKRGIDFCLALAGIIVLLPLFSVVSILVLLDSGFPVLFWQQRVGRYGAGFLLYKFRTLCPPFDWRGKLVPPEERLSWSGRMLRDKSLDELPQLLSVLIGDMSLIGPRPLLPEDQPADPSVRLMVRPGITGWAQVNGGKLLNAEEKDKLDEWYVRNASFWVDLRVLWKTVQIVLLGARSEEAAADKREIESRRTGQPKDETEQKLPSSIPDRTSFVPVDPQSQN
jgi:lipopolysaccharide/colanic/teichoic acid biosynthesis glycosyltransferase